MLEQELALNNTLLAENNTLMKAFIAAISAREATSTSKKGPISGGSTQLTADGVPENFSGAITPNDVKKETSKPETKPAGTAVFYVDTMDLSHLAAAAVLFDMSHVNGEGATLSENKYEEVKEVVHTTKETPDSLKMNQLYMASQNINPPIGTLLPYVQLQAFTATIKFWDELKGLDGRRDFIQLWVNTPVDARSALKPVKKATKKTAAKKEIQQEVKNEAPETPATEATTENAITMEILIEEFRKLAGANRQEAVRILGVFGASKLSEVKQDNYENAYNAIKIAIGE